MKIRKINRLITRVLAMLLAVLPVLSSGAAAENAAAEKHLAGYYVCFEEENGVMRAKLRRGILSLRDGMITQIREYAENEPDTVYLDPNCVILPGLLDLHAHFAYNCMQLWDSDETDIPWDNRFEWRDSADNYEVVESRMEYLEDVWADVLYPENESILKGDVITYFMELQAVSEGTVLVQGGSTSHSGYDFRDSHEKNQVIRFTVRPEDLGRNNGLPIQSINQLYVPDVQVSREDPSTYLPPIDTSEWEIKRALRKGQESLQVLFDGIAGKTEDGWLIHLAEGRAGYLASSSDSYTRKEIDTFKQDMTDAVARGLFTAEDVRNAHVCLIHSCAVDLSKKEDRAFFAEYGIGLIWSPVSNMFLYKDTPDLFRYMDDPELMIAIGSDWSPSGSKCVWDECQFAYDLIDILGQETDTTRENLLKACTVVPAKMLGDDRMGNIREGAFADLFILRAGEDVDGRLDAALNAFIKGTLANVEAVLIRGNAEYGEQDFLGRFNGDETLSGYGQYIKGDNKFYRIPAAFAGKSLETLYADYLALLDEAKVEVSMLRRTEDTVYESQINELTEGLKGVE